MERAAPETLALVPSHELRVGNPWSSGAGVTAMRAFRE